MKRIVKWKNQSNEVIYTGNVYYLNTSSGNDSNNGLTTSSAWKTESFAETQLEDGDVLLLDDVGEGEMPKTGFENFYKYKLNDTVYNKILYGWEIDDTNTGVENGIQLSEYGEAGTPLEVVVDDALFENLDILSTRSDGGFYGINIRANNVHFKNCKIHDELVIYYGSGGFTGLLIENCEFIGGACGGPNNYTLKKCYIHEVTDGPHITGSNVLIENCYIYVNGEATGHNDCIQGVGGPNTDITIRYNRLCNINTATSVINLKGTRIEIHGNFLAGGGSTIYSDDATTYETITNNHFSTLYYPNCGYNNLTYEWYDENEGNEWSGNIWHETELPCNP